MGDQTAISWTEATLNPWTGCTKVSAGCAKCYIAGTPPFRMAGRKFVKGHIPLEFHLERLDRMIRRRKPMMYFVNSLSDVFHEDVPDEYVARLFAAMLAAPQHTFQVLTKRPERMRALLNDDGFADAVLNPDAFSELWPDPWPLPNVWLGVSIENRRFVHRADLLRETPAAVRFISAEPLLGPLISHTDCEHRARCVGDPDCDDCMCEAEGGDRTILGAEPWSLDLDGIDWLIAGGESGSHHRPMRIEWMRDLHDACRMSGTAWFAKQDSGARAGQQGRIPADLWVHEWPAVREPGDGR